MSRRKSPARVAGNALDIDLDFVGILHASGLVPRQFNAFDVGLLKLVFNAFDGAVCHALESVLQLHLHHQLRAAFQVEAQPDVVSEVGDQFGLGLGNADDAVDTGEHDGDDDGCFDFEISLHIENRPLSRFSFPRRPAR